MLIPEDWPLAHGQTFRVDERANGLVRLVQRARRSLHKRSLWANVLKICGRHQVQPRTFHPDDFYKQWIALYDTPTDADRARIYQAAMALKSRPKVSIVMTTYESDPRFLSEAVESIRSQAYDNWELCIADDGSRSPVVIETLRCFAAEESRLKVQFLPRNLGIAAAGNAALSLVEGELVAFVDHDDVLRFHALFAIVRSFLENPAAQVIFSDEDKIDGEGRRSNPFFKSDWNPELMLRQNAVNHLTVMRTTAIRAVGGFRAGLDGSQDWDLLLRVSAKFGPGSIRHLPLVLYHWRQLPNASNFSEKSTGRALNAATKLVRDFLDQSGEKADIRPLGTSTWLSVRRAVPSPAPLVSVIIPTRNQRKYLERCITGLLQRTDYPRLEIIIVDNGSDETDAVTYLRECAGNPMISVVAAPGPFNYPALNNTGVAAARGEVLAFLNNDVDVINADWLSEMVSHAVRASVGAVGAKLYYPDDSIQHAGIVLGAAGIAGHSFRHCQRDHPGPAGLLMLTRNVSAVTGACLVMRHSVYREVGGFDTAFRVALNDVDLCLRVRAAGYQVVWTPLAELYHYESASRGSDDSDERRGEFRKEWAMMIARYGDLLFNDPFYNPNLTLAYEDHRVAFPPRSMTAWGFAKSSAATCPDLVRE